MLGLMSGLEDTGMIDRVSHFHGPSGQELYGISDDATIVREEYDYAIWIPPARQVEEEKAFKRVERLSKSYITFQASDQLIESFDRDLYDVDCFRYTVDLWSHVRGSLVNQSFLIFGATLVLLLMAGLIEFAVARFSQPFMQLAQAMQRFSQAPPNEQRPSFEFDLTTGTNLFRHLAKGFNQMEAAVRESTQRVASLNTSYESLLSRANIGFIATDTVGNIEYINPTADDLMRAVTDLPARIQAETENDADVASINVSNQDQVLNLLATQTSRVNLNGVIDGKWLIVYDVSALRSTERKLLEAQRLSTLGQLTTGMSHEISQPLQAMTLTVANLKRSLRDHIEEKPTLGEKLRRIDGNLHKIANLIKFMQTYGGAGSLTDESFDPGESINKALTGYQDSSCE
jgi:nitrogen fixation/metabolism regulation signal transduction histidine kinase